MKTAQVHSPPLPGNSLAERSGSLQPGESDGAEYFAITPPEGWAGLGLRELWEYRELVYYLTWRDVKIRYKQSILGIAWAVIQPLATMLVFSLFFGKLAKMPSDGVPYPLFSLAALVPWTYFSTAVTQTSQSIVGNTSLITKIFFPRLAVPLASILAALVDLLIALALLFAALLIFAGLPGMRLLWLPLLIAVAVVSALGVGLWLAAMNVQFRDVRHAVPFLVQFWLFATPVAYPSSLLDPAWRAIYALNPMVGVVEGFRWALLGLDTEPGSMIAVSAFSAAAILVTGVLYFRKMESNFADII